MPGFLPRFEFRGPDAETGEVAFVQALKLGFGHIDEARAFRLGDGCDSEADVVDGGFYIHLCATFGLCAPLLRCVRHFCAVCATFALCAPLLRCVRHFCAVCATFALCAPLLRCVRHFRRMCATFVLVNIF